MSPLRFALCRLAVVIQLKVCCLTEVPQRSIASNLENYEAL